jgi:hypothetical protein
MRGDRAFDAIERDRATGDGESQKGEGEQLAHGRAPGEFSAVPAAISMRWNRLFQADESDAAGEG